MKYVNKSVNFRIYFIDFAYLCEINLYLSLGKMKYFKKIATAFVAILTMFSLGGCHKADEIRLTYSIRLSEELQDVANAEVCYTDFDGKEYREPIEDGMWETTIVTPQPPAATKIRVELSRNSNTCNEISPVLDMTYSCMAERVEEGEIMESVSSIENFCSVAINNNSIAESLESLEFERSYVLRSASDGSLTMEKFTGTAN